MTPTTKFVNQILNRFKEPFPFNITDQVFLEIEKDNAFQELYVQLGSPNRQIGRAVKYLTGYDSIHGKSPVATYIDRFSLLIPPGDEAYQALPQFYQKDKKSSYAREFLRLLVTRAINGYKPIYYSDLIKFGGYSRALLGKGLKIMADTLEEIHRLQGNKIPSIQTLVISKENDLPADGINSTSFCPDYLNLTITKKREAIAKEHDKVYQFKYWQELLRILGYDAWKMKSDSSFTIRNGNPFSKEGGGESDEHKRLKEYIRQNPRLIGENLQFEQFEYEFPSRDKVDLLFTNGDNDFIGVEVKPTISDVEDIRRGLFQCVKYEALARAENQCNFRNRKIRVVLAMGNKFPHDLYNEMNSLDIEVIPNLGYH